LFNVAFLKANRNTSNFS